MHLANFTSLKAYMVFTMNIFKQNAESIKVIITHLSCELGDLNWFRGCFSAVIFMNGDLNCFRGCFGAVLLVNGELKLNCFRGCFSAVTLVNGDLKLNCFRGCFGGSLSSSCS